MANLGAKFVSANLNKSYGQNHHHTHHAHFNGGGGSYGQAAAAGRGRPGSGSGGGMLILSRNRGGAQKVASKLSVPPPLNLPSLRKEHEKFDMSGPGGAGSCAGSGNGPRPTSSGLGWTKPIAAATALPEKNDSGVDFPGVDGMDDAAGASRGTGSYMPPSVRSTGVGLRAPTSASRDFPQSAEKAMLLRGEDFPSLQAARPASSGTSQKQKDGSDQKHKQVIHDKLTQDKEDSYHLGPMADAHTLGQSSGNTDGKRSVENGSVVHGRVGGRMTDQTRKQEEYFPDPLPLVHMNPRSDWADDERDTGHGFLEHRRDTGYSNSESYWDRDFDVPRTSVLPQKPASNQYERWGQQDNGTGKNFSTEVLKIDAYNKNVKTPSREGKEVNSWRTSPLSKDGFSSQEVRSYRMDIGSRMASNSNMVKENKYVLPHHGNTVLDSSTILSRDSTFGRRNLGHVGQQIQQNTSVGSFNSRGTIRNFRDHHVPEQSNGCRSDNFQNNTLSKPSPASSAGRPSITGPILPMGWDKRFSKNDNPFSEDPFLRDFGSAGFDERDIFSDGLVGVIKRKKDAAKSTDFHDPVRESFEAELERVQKMQELERQRIIEEQERALEQVRREEEERQRRIREEEEMQRRLEEEACEVALRAEMEQLEAIQRAEERRIAREEDKKRLHLEEERRKEAANLKLQELEARMAKRQAEAARNDAFASKTIVDEKLDKYKSRNVDLDSWEDGERMLENVMTSGSFESYSNSRPAEMSSRPYPHRDSSSSSLDRGKSFNSWRRDVVENCASSHSQPSKQETGHFSPQQDSIDDDRAGPCKDLHGGAGYMSSRAYLKPVVQEAYSDEFGYQKVQRWNLSGNADSYGKFREMDSEFRDVTDKNGDSGWGMGQTQGGTLPHYPEPLYPNSEVNEYSYGRSRYSMRQPRVLPPPSLVSAQRTNFRGVGESYGPSTFLDNGIRFTHATRAQSTQQTDYHGSNHGGLESSEIFELQQECSTAEGPKLNNGSRCESQSSLSVSSPPTSPHLSHDDLDESGDSPTTAVAEWKENLLIGSGSVAHNGKSGNGTATIVTDSISPIEDEEWALENDEPMQHQEEYDEDEGGYREEDEVREKDDDNVELNQKFDILKLEECESPHVMDNVVLGFDEGIEVIIPSVDTEKNIRNQEKSFVIPDGSVEERGIVDGFHSDKQNLPTADDSRVASADSSCVKVPENSGLQGSIGQHVGIPCSEATTDHLNGADSLGSTCLAAQQTVPASSGDVASATNRPINLLSSPSAGSQGNLPTKLQFGLFSGPSLIPSPMPAIQIGSIQMPLHIHPPIGPSIQMHPSQPPMFQFGQLRYPSPISQGILPMGPQSMSFVQPNMHFNLNQNAVGTVTHEPPLDASRQNGTKDERLNKLSNRPSIVSTSPEQTNERLSPCLDTVSKAESHDNNCAVHSSSSGATGPCDEKLRSGSGTQVERKAAQHAAFKSYLPAFKARGSDSQSLHVQPTMQSIAGEKNSNGLRSLGPSSGGRGRRFAYAAKNANTRSFVWDYDMPQDTNEFQRRPRRAIQRTEFRIRENNDRTSAPLLSSSSAAGLDVKSNYSGKTVGVFTRSGFKRSMVSNRTHKQSIESESLASGNIISRDVKPGDRVEKETGRDLSIRSRSNSYTDETKMRINISEEDVDAPIQSGVVRVFKQPGIEAPSDEDDFIEVRSKRQMLNDRREQREKEIKAKARTTKPPRKPRVYRQKDVILRSHSKNSLPLVSEEPVNPQFDFSASDGPPLANGVSTVFTTAASQPPIGTPFVNSETHRPSQAGSVAVVSEGRPERESGPMSDSKNKVMSLSQKQIDEAMKPARYDSHISAVGGHSSTATDPGLPTSSVLAKDKKFSSGASPINSLLAGEKIQFGAVTSSTVLPRSTHVVSHGIGASGSNCSDVQASHNFSVAEKDSCLFFEKEKHLTDSCVPLQGCEAEAEAAASAVAVAAISSDEMVRDRLGSVNDTKSFAGADIDVITTGVVGDQHTGNHSQGVELLTVSLPADLSVETTPISLWQPLPSPQSSSTQMLSHFPAGPPSHFPFYEMNPLLGSPIFAFSPHEESSVTQSQPPKTTPSGSGPLGNWQQCHSGVDSFYGPPAGYSGPFIGPPGVQAHPHMVVYNHFAPVGQYGQVGLSFMGTTYIPSGKQADWKSNTTSNPMHIGQGDVSANVTSVQRSAMTAPIQHLAPGSPLLPMPPSLPMFDALPFQTASDLPVQARWGHIPTSPLHSIPVSRPSQSQVEGALPSQANHGHPVDQSFSAHRFTESRTPTPSDNAPAITVSSDKNAAPFPAELGLVDPLRSTAPSSGPGRANAESGKNDKIDGGKQLGASSMKSPFFKKNTSAQQGNNTGLYYQRGGPSQRSNAGNEPPHRRMGFHGRKQSYGVDKGFPGSKMKQIYVAKQIPSGSSST